MASIWDTPGKPIEPGDTDGFVNVSAFNIYYRIYGKDGKKGTVMCLMGGPGPSLDAFRPLTDLTEYGYRVILYDQLGCGNSQVPKNKAIFSLEHFVEELEGLRDSLDLGKVSLVGWSWGGMLAMAYAVRYQDNIKAMVSTGGPASMPLCYQEMIRLKTELPKDVQATFEKYETEGDYQNPEYVKAEEVYLRNFVCRLPDWPPEMLYSFQHIGEVVFQTMWGPCELVCVGMMRYLDITDELTEIRVPTLITCGRYDEVTPTTCKNVHDHVRGSKFEIFENSSHSGLWEERERYLQLVRTFLDKHG